MSFVDELKKRFTEKWNNEIQDIVIQGWKYQDTAAYRESFVKLLEEVVGGLQKQILENWLALTEEQKNKYYHSLNCWIPHTFINEQLGEIEK